MADHGLQVGTPEIATVGAITFGPDDVLFVADSIGAAVFAIDVADRGDTASSEAFDVPDLDAQLGALLGAEPDDLVVRDMAVHPRTHSVYLSVTRGRGADALPLIVKVDRATGALSEVSLRDVPFSRVDIHNAPGLDDERVDTQLVQAPEGEEFEFNGQKLRLARQPVRTVTVTDMAYDDGVLFVAGLSNEEFASSLRRIAFPFEDAEVDSSLEIFHVSHGAWETKAPIRTFVLYDEGQSMLASYTCTPLVHFRFSEMSEGAKTVGRTVAELGARNMPLDMVSYRTSDGEHLLITHSHHPAMTVACADIDTQDALTEPTEPTGVPRREVDLPGVTKLANLNGRYILALQHDEDGGRRLRSLETASL